MRVKADGGQDQGCAGCFCLSSQLVRQPDRSPGDQPRLLACGFGPVPSFKPFGRPSFPHRCARAHRGWCAVGFPVGRDMRVIASRFRNGAGEAGAATITTLSYCILSVLHVHRRGALGSAVERLPPSLRREGTEPRLELGYCLCAASTGTAVQVTALGARDQLIARMTSRAAGYAWSRRNLRRLPRGV